MTLAKWLEQRRWTNLRFAQAIGVSEECARLYRAALRRPSPATAQCILIVTDQAVTPADMARAYDDRMKGKVAFTPKVRHVK